MRRATPSISEVAQRWGSVLVGAAVFVLVGWMTVEASGPPHAAALKKDAGAAGASAAANGGSGPDASSSFESALAVDAGELDAGLSLPLLGFPDAAFASSGVMPSGAPRQVKLGVVLVTFAGAEGAPPNARSKREALEIAERLGRDAHDDFHHAVSGGDPGSADDIGRIPRGVLDPRTEIAVFALESGAVSDVLETPRGFWVVKRLD